MLTRLRIFVAILLSLPCLACYHIGIPGRTAARRATLARCALTAADSSTEDEELDALVRKEIETAFAGLEEKFAKGEDEEALKIIETQGKTILANVFQKLEDDGSLLSSQLASQVEELAADKSNALLEKYETELAAIGRSLNTERENIRSEMRQLETLNKELQELQGGGGGGINRNTIVGGAAFLVGLTGVGAAINEALKFAVGGQGDAATLGLNAALGVAGVAIYFQRKGKAS